MISTDYLRAAETLAEHIGDGVIDEYYVIAHIGETRSQALSANGRDPQVLELVSDGGHPRDQIGAWMRERAEDHAHGPLAYMYAVLRKSDNKGNVAISPPVPVGGEEARIAEESAAQRALAYAIEMGPLTLRLMSGLLTHTLTELKDVQIEEKRAQIAIADMNARAESADDTAKWEAIASSVQELGPMAREAFTSWMRSQNPPAQDPATMTEDDLTDLFNRAPDETKAAFMQRLQAAMQAQQAQQAPGGDA
jgi:hypothetical protein